MRIAIRLAIMPVIGATAVLVAQPAWSAPPGTTTTTFQSPRDVPSVCDFPVEIAITAAQFERTTLPNGTVVVTGPGTATVTNLVTQESATYNISGPGFLEPTDEGLRFNLRGSSLILGPEGQTNGDNFLIVTSGRVSFIENQPIDEPLRGHIRHDVCAELA